MSSWRRSTVSRTGAFFCFPEVLVCFETLCLERFGGDCILLRVEEIDARRLPILGEGERCLDLGVCVLEEL